MLAKYLTGSIKDSIFIDSYHKEYNSSFTYILKFINFWTCKNDILFKSLKMGYLPRNYCN